MPSCLFRTVGAIGWFDIVDDRTGAVPRFQPDGKHVVRHELLDDANFVSDDLRPHIAFTVIRPRASTQFGDGFRNQVERLFGGGLTDRDGFRRAMEIEKADMADARRDVDVRRVPGEPHAGEAILHDVE